MAVMKALGQCPCYRCSTPIAPWELPPRLQDESWALLCALRTRQKNLRGFFLTLRTNCTRAPCKMKPPGRSHDPCRTTESSWDPTCGHRESCRPPRSPPCAPHSQGKNSAPAWPVLQQNLLSVRWDVAVQDCTTCCTHAAPFLPGP